MQYFKSENIKVFPCANRGSAVDDAGNIKNFNSESRLNTEYNLINISGTAGGVNSYIIGSKNPTIEETGYIKFLLGGYYFEINNITQEDTLGILNSATVGIKIKSVYLDTHNATSILANLNNEAFDNLDEKDNDEYYFKGLAVITTGEQEKCSYYLKISNGATLSSATSGILIDKIDTKALTIGSGTNSILYDAKTAKNIIAGTNISFAASGNNLSINATGEPAEYIKSATTSGQSLKLTKKDGSVITYTPTGEPNTYIKSASTSGNTLTLTKKDNSTVVYTPTFTEQYKGTVTSVQVQASGGLTSSNSTKQTAVLTTTIGIDDAHYLPTTTDKDNWDKKTKVSVSSAGSSSSVVKYITIDGIESKLSADDAGLPLYRHNISIDSNYNGDDLIKVIFTYYSTDATAYTSLDALKAKLNNLTTYTCGGEIKPDKDASYYQVYGIQKDTDNNKLYVYYTKDSKDTCLDLMLYTATIKFNDVLEAMDAKVKYQNDNIYFDNLLGRPKYNGAEMQSSTNIPEVKTAIWDAKQDAISAGTGISISGTTISVDSSIATKAYAEAYADTKSVVSGEGTDENWTKITINGTTKNIPQGGGGGGSYTAGANINNTKLGENIIAVVDEPTFNKIEQSEIGYINTYNATLGAKQIELKDAYSNPNLSDHTYTNLNKASEQIISQFNENNKLIYTNKARDFRTEWTKYDTVTEKATYETTVGPQSVSTYAYTLKDGRTWYDSSNKQLCSQGEITADKIIYNAIGTTVDSMKNLIPDTGSGGENYLLNARSTLYFFPKINGDSRPYNSGTTYYAPTESGNAGQILKSGGANTTPYWADSGSSGPMSAGSNIHIDDTKNEISVVDEPEWKKVDTTNNQTSKVTITNNKVSNYFSTLKSGSPCYINETSLESSKIKFYHASTGSTKQTYSISFPDAEFEPDSSGTYDLLLPQKSGIILASNKVELTDVNTNAALRFYFGTDDNTKDTFILRPEATTPNKQTYTLKLPSKTGTLATIAEVTNRHIVQHNITIAAQSGAAVVYLSILTNSTTALNSYESLVTFLNSATKTGGTTTITEMGASGIIAGSSSYLIYKIIKESDDWKIKAGTIEKSLSTYSSGYTFTDNTYTIL